MIQGTSTPIRIFRGLGVILSAFTVFLISWARTEGGVERYWQKYYLEDSLGLAPFITTDGLANFIPLAVADLREAQLTRKPDDWLPFDMWLDEYRDVYRKRHGIPFRAYPVVPGGQVWSALAGAQPASCGNRRWNSKRKPYFRAMPPDYAVGTSITPKIPGTTG